MSEASSTRPSSGRRKILVSVRRKRVTDKAIEALATRPNIYKRDGTLVRVVRDDGEPCQGIKRELDSPRIDLLPLPSLAEELTEAAQFYGTKILDGKKVRMKVHPPTWVVATVAARGTWPTIRRLRGVVECPALRPDGSVLQDPGYDPATGLLYQPSTSYPRIPDNPTWEDIERAREDLLEVVCDFPFSEPVHRAAWFAGLLTGFARHAYEGFTPFFLVDGNVRGSGKSKLVDCAALISTGRSAARTTQATKEEEEEKQITSIALAGDPLILIDNIRHPFGSGKFDAALTGEAWKGRLLATNIMPRLKIVSVFWGTGNNVRFAPGVDTERRTLKIRIESPEENPEKRQAFRHPDLLAWVRENRGRLAAAALTILSAYVRQGKADQLHLKNWGSFEQWSALVRSCVVWVGLPDPYGAYEAMTEASDSAASAVEDLVEGWAELCKENGDEACTAQQAVQYLDEDLQYRAMHPSHRLRYERLRAALNELMRLRHDRLPASRDLGLLLRSYNGRVVKGKRLRPMQRKAAGVPWAVENLEKR